MNALDLRALKQQFTKARLLALAEREGVPVRAGKMRCPARCSDALDSASVWDNDDGAGWKCWRCEARGDVFSFLGHVRNLHDFKDQLAAAQELAGVVVQMKTRGRPPAPPIEKLWGATSEDDPQAREYLRGRGLELALERGLCRCNVGRAQWYWLDRYADRGYRVAMALRGVDGQLVSLAVRAVVPVDDPKKRMLNCAGIPSANTAFGDVAAAQSAPRVYLAEGMADTLALQLAGVTVVGSPGVHAISSLPKFCGDVRGRELVFCLQNDPENSKAHAQALSLFSVAAEAAQNAGARALLLRPPAQHKDPADWLKAIGLEAFTAAVQNEPAESVIESSDEPDFDNEENQESQEGLPEPNVIELPRRFALTDTGNAERLVALFGEDLRYCHDWGCWLVWDKTRWRRDTDLAIMRYAKATARQMRTEYERETERRRKNPLLQKPDEYLYALGTHAKKTESADRRRALISLAQSELPVSVLAERLDARPWSLNLANGTLDLRTGQLSPHQREDQHTKCVSIEFDKDAKCTRWILFLHQIFLDNIELIDFIQRAIGYSLSGLTREQVFFLCCGPGENGKSVFLAILEALLGEYALSADFSTFASRDVAPGAPRPDLVRLRGARLVTAAEPSGDTHFSEATLKLITGEDHIVARSLHEREQQFVPVLKLWLMANHRPRVSESSHGFWRRVRLIPFDYRVPEAQKDPELKAKLRAELPGILNWALQGCLDWQRNGLGQPAIVAAATAEYRNDMDTLGQFLAECTERNDATRNLSVPSAEVFDCYVKWAANLGIKPLSHRGFSNKLRDRGILLDRNKVSRFFCGIRILEK